MTTASKRPSRRKDVPPTGKARMRLVDFSKLFNAPPVERVQYIRKGVLPQDVKELATHMGLSQDLLSKYMHLAPATLTRKAAKQEALSAEASERVIGLARLIGQVESLVERSGGASAGFDAATWTAQWLEEPLPALGGLKPASYLDTLEGQRLVSNLIETMISGAYA